MAVRRAREGTKKTMKKLSDLTKRRSKKPRLVVATESVSQTSARGRGRQGDVLCVMGRKRCSHGKVKQRCADCNPCPHGKVKHDCADCNPCPHSKLKRFCAACNPCPHGKLKRFCVDCNPCPHGKNKYRCATCKAARAGQPAPPRKRKRDPEIKLEPEIKQEPFTIRGYFGLDR
jgi:hypothetical protein